MCVACCSLSLSFHTHVPCLHSRQGWAVGLQFTEMHILEIWSVSMEMRVPG